MTHFTGSVIEQAYLDWMHGLGYCCAIGPERTSHEDVALVGRLQEAIARITPPALDNRPVRHIIARNIRQAATRTSTR